MPEPLDPKMEQFKNLVQLAFGEDRLDGKKFAEGFGIIISIIKQLKDQVEEGVNAIGPMVEDNVRKLDGRISDTQFHATQIGEFADRRIKKRTKKLRMEFAGQLSSLQTYLEQIDTTVDALLYEKENAVPFEYTLTLDDKEEILKQISKDFPKEKLDELRELGETLKNEIVKIRSIPIGGMDFGAPFEQVIKAGANVTVSKDPSGAWVISSTGGGGSATFVDNEIVSGSGTSWTLSFSPVAGSVHVFGGGSRLTLDVDYSISGDTITTVNSYDSGQVVADYRV